MCRKSSLLAGKIDGFLCDLEKVFKHTLIYVFAFCYSLKRGKEIPYFNLVIFIQEKEML